MSNALRDHDLELEEIINNLPRYSRGPLNARVWVDASGRLCIYPEGGGFLGVPEEVVYTIIEADAKDSIQDDDY